MVIITLALMLTPGEPALGQSLPTIEFESTNVSVDEPDQSPYRANVTLTVKLNPASTQNASVRYRTADTTAKTAERDYNSATGTLYFNPGTTERTITITVLNDTTVESSERFGVELFQPNAAVLNSSRDKANITIQDDDHSAPYNLIAPATVRENQGTFTVVVERASTPIVDKIAELYVDHLPGTASSGTHYRPISQRLTFNKGETKKTFQVEVINNTTDHPDKSFSIRMAHNGADDDQIILGTTLVTVTIQDEDPATPTNLEMTHQTTDKDLDHVAVLQWDYSDAEGYLLESRDGTTGPWNCVVAGTYSSREPTGISTVSTTRGGPMGASEDWHFRVRNFTSQQFSHAGEATCNQDADYGYIFGATDGHGYNLSPADTLGPVAIPEIDPTVAPDQAPTGLTIAAGAKHRDVQISWDPPPEESNVTGFALYRKWKGLTGTPQLCLYWSTKSSELITSYQDTHVAAYDDSDNKNKYEYRVYPLNDAVPKNLSAPGGCDDYRPTSVPSAMVTATLALSPDITKNSDGDLEYASPPAPLGLNLEPRIRGYRNDISAIRATWNDVDNAPGYKVRWRESGETDWREQGRSRTLEPNANACTEGDNPGTIISTLNDGRVWCVRENGKLLVTSVTPWPQMFNSGPGKPNDNIASTHKGFGFLKNSVQHEVQVATCTDQSCDSAGAWSPSRYAYSR